ESGPDEGGRLRLLGLFFDFFGDRHLDWFGGGELGTARLELGIQRGHRLGLDAVVQEVGDVELVTEKRQHQAGATHERPARAAQYSASSHGMGKANCGWRIS